jgi:hypothetical protein
MTDGGQREADDMTARLWEIDHPYYCHDSNFHAKGCNHSYASWDSFLAEFVHDDKDLNLLFRFDWNEGEGEFDGDESRATATLSLFFMQQRIGAFLIRTVDVSRADEPEVLKFLRPRFEHMLDLWQPFVAEATETARREIDNRFEVERERDEMKAAWLSAERRVEEAVRGLDYLNDIDEVWECYGFPNNRRHLSLAEQVSVTLRELDEARDEIERLKQARVD